MSDQETKKKFFQLADLAFTWVVIDKDGITLVFLPGLTADHRLFDKQVEYFESKYTRCCCR